MSDSALLALVDGIDQRLRILEMSDQDVRSIDSKASRLDALVRSQDQEITNLKTEVLALRAALASKVGQSSIDKSLLRAAETIGSTTGKVLTDTKTEILATTKSMHDSSLGGITRDLTVANRAARASAEAAADHLISRASMLAS